MASTAVIALIVGLNLFLIAQTVGL
jgi:hypothetical protein